MSYSVSVVIPNYNGEKLLQEYLPYVTAALKHAGVDSEIIISDDASTDGSVKFIRENYQQIKITRSGVNQGFSYTVNRGIQLAEKKLVLLLNSDVKLKEDYFDSQWKYFDDPQTFGVMGSIWSEEGRKLMDGAKYPVWKGGQLKTTINCMIMQKNDRPCYTLFLSGANALISRDKLMELKGMDTRYSPFYMEDVDLSVRAWRSGWKCYYEQQAICHHKLSETISAHNTNKKVNLISKRNKFIFHNTHLEGRKRLLWNTENYLNLLFRWIILDTDYYRSYFEYKKIILKEKNKKNYSKSLQEVTNEIIKSFEGLKKDLF